MILVPVTALWLLGLALVFAAALVIAVLVARNGPIEDLNRERAVWAVERQRLLDRHAADRAAWHEQRRAMLDRLECYAKKEREEQYGQR